MVAPSDISDLFERVKKRSYKRYVLQLRMHNVRSFADQEIRFDFPITALIGTNGGGKSTVLGAAALAYKTVKPGQFFPKSNVSDNSMANWKIEYELLDRPGNAKAVMRNARFVAQKWRRDNAPDRDVVIIPIQRGRCQPMNKLNIAGLSGFHSNNTQRRSCLTRF
jgi:ABC-type Mn2+/Zn2+ transport system ATPase subunit